MPIGMFVVCVSCVLSVCCSVQDIFLISTVIIVWEWNSFALKICAEQIDPMVNSFIPFQVKDDALITSLRHFGFWESGHIRIVLPDVRFSTIEKCAFGICWQLEHMNCLVDEAQHNRFLRIFFSTENFFLPCNSSTSFVSISEGDQYRTECHHPSLQMP